MKERLGNFGDVVFGLLLAGIVASYVGPLEHLVSAMKAHVSPSISPNDVQWMAMAPILQFIIVCIFWALQARIISRLFVDHVAFILGYLGVLYFLFGWVLMDAAIQGLLLATGIGKIDFPIAMAPALMISTAFAILLFLGIGGLTYHWSEISPLRRYENLRECCFVALSAALAGWVVIQPAIIQQPFDALLLLALLITARFIMAMFLDPWMTKRFGSLDERRHYAKVLFAGSVLMLFFGLLFTVLFASAPHVLPTALIWVGCIFFIAIALLTVVQGYRAVKKLPPVP